MEFRSFDIEGPIEIIPKMIADDRGYFSEIFRADEFAKYVPGITFTQDNQSLSVRRGTIRGIHFQAHPHAQGKLVRCLAGAVLDVAVDLRRDSKTFGGWISTTLTPDQNNQLWIPIGFGHAFCTLEPNSMVTYRVTDYYSSKEDSGVAWNDTEIGIKWPPIADADTLSKKDRSQPSLAELPPYFSLLGR